MGWGWISSLRRPIGAWRFLTFFDKPQAGDLWRFALSRASLDDSYDIALNLGWTEIKLDTEDEDIYSDPEIEIIRPYDETGVSEPMFELIND